MSPSDVLVQVALSEKRLGAVRAGVRPFSTVLPGIVSSEIGFDGSLEDEIDAVTSDTWMANI